jgi:uracil-DNA glycosylase
MGEKVASKNRDDKRELQHVKNPSYIETECCRPQVQQDILDVRPEAVIVIGKVTPRMDRE